MRGPPVFNNNSHFEAKSGRSSFYSINANNVSNFGCPVTQALHKDERLLCSGVGKNCSAATDFKCNCTAGFTGPGCEYVLLCLVPVM